MSTTASSSPQSDTPTIENPDDDILGFKCPICNTKPLLWFFQEGCTLYRHAKLKELFRHHLFGPSSFHRKFNEDLEKSNPLWIEPELFDQVQNALEARTKSLKKELKVVQKDEGWSDTTFKQEVEEGRWRFVHSMFAGVDEDGCRTPEDPYFRRRWVKAVFINEDTQCLRRTAIADPGIRHEAEQMIYSINAVKEFARIAKAKLRETFTDMKYIGTDVVDKFESSVTQHLTKLHAHWHRSIRSLQSSNSAPVQRAGQDVHGTGSNFPSTPNFPIAPDIIIGQGEVYSGIELPQLADQQPFDPQQYELDGFAVVLQELETSNTTSFTNPSTGLDQGSSYGQEIDAGFQDQRYQHTGQEQGINYNWSFPEADTAQATNFYHDSYSVQSGDMIEQGQIEESEAVRRLQEQYQHGLWAPHQLLQRPQRAVPHNQATRYSPYHQYMTRPRS